MKTPVQGPVHAHKLALEGDDQADKTVHGGPYRALYAYPHEHYQYWETHAGLTDWPLGGFGENLTITHLNEDTVHMGDILRLGTVLAQVTQPRSPCATLAMRVGSIHFPKLFSESGKTGFYMRVLEEGEITTGDPIEFVERHPAKLTVRRCYRLRIYDRHDAEGMAMASQIDAIEPAWRAWFQAHANS